MSGVSDEKIQQFMALANCSFSTAQQYLRESGDLNEALNAYYAAQADTEGGKEQKTSDVGANTATSQSASGSQSRSSTTSSSAGKNSSKTRFMTFSDMVKDQADDDEDDDQNRNTFAGGETSGLEVADPNDSNSLIRDLLEKAKRRGQQVEQESDAEQPKTKPKHFSGKGYRLGSVVDTPSEVVENNPQDTVPERPKKVTREITFWREGFQVGDGPLYRYDDPANSFYLNELNQGRAPLKLLDVEYGQEVDVNVYKKLDESYKAPKRRLGGFQGQGQRLGSPVPGDNSNASNEEPVRSPSPEQKTERPKSETPKGDSLVQIRYASGKREVFHCNATDTVQSLYDHVRSNTSPPRDFNLNHAFPVKPVKEYQSTLKDAGLVNAVVVQRWV